MTRLVRTRRSGFTLVELLVVVAIIGILAGMISANVNSARAKARDGRRANDVKQIQTALELYYDTSGRYPPMKEGECGGTEGYTVSSNDFMKSLVDRGYLGAFPEDPKRIECNIQYRDDRDGEGYIIFVHFEQLPANKRCTPPNDGGHWSCFGVNTSYMQ